MKNFCATLHRLLETINTVRNDHEFLYVSTFVRMGATIDNIHHWHRHNETLTSGKIFIQWLLTMGCRRLGRGQRYRQNRIRTQFGFIVRAIQIEHGLIQLRLLGSVHTLQRGIDGGVDNIDRFGHTFTEKTLLLAIAHFQRFQRTRRGTGGHCRPPKRAARQSNLCFYRGVTA